ncbi:DUF1697 domain-containing protein [Longivirga aurantiaca]|uniref:DUF1697 domain-containing protein n=1 Tax=Longivirga aurantiaca TaxID=1837743 RepID=A0ABW1T026_9ACTN
MPTWVALLRAVNLGSHNKVSMPALRTALAEAGYADVRTYMQSGNVILSSPVRTPGKVASGVGDVLRASFGIDTPVLVRTPRQLRAVAEWSPFAEQAAERPASVHVLHLDTAPDATALATLLSTDWGADLVAARELEIVIAYGETMHDSRLQHGAILKRLATTGTARNWRTLLALVDLC